MIMTRWHLDDLAWQIHRALSRRQDPRYPAIAEEDEKNRRKGEALFPEHKSLPFLMERRRSDDSGRAGRASISRSPSLWAAASFRSSKLPTSSRAFDREQIQASVRYVDKAGTKEGGAYSAFVLMHMHARQAATSIEDVVRGQWSALDREQRLLQVAQSDKMVCHPPVYTVWVEQEPGSGGKESAENIDSDADGLQRQGGQGQRAGIQRGESRAVCRAGARRQCGAQVAGRGTAAS